MKIAKSIAVILMVATIKTVCGHSHVLPVGSSSTSILAPHVNAITTVGIPCASDVRCRCTASASGGIVADCSDLNISVIPHFSSNVTHVLLQRNDIRYLRIMGDQVVSSILYLDISENKLEKIIGDPFKSMKALQHLDLSSNFLPYTSSVFSNEVFHGLKSLTYLNLKWNNHNDRVGFNNLTYPVSIGHITTLKTCLLDGVDPAGFTGDFRHLTNLESLDLEGYMGVCVLSILRSNYFENVSSIKHLNLSYCKIRSIELGTFRVLTNLYSLNISHNDRLTFSVLSNLSDDLQHLPIHTLDISKLHCDYGPGIALYVQDIDKISNHTYLTNIYIDSNRLSLPEFGVVTKLPKSLRLLSVKENRLTYGSYIFELASAISLEFFDGSNQYSSHDPIYGSKDCNDWRAPPSTNNDNSSADSNAALDIVKLSAFTINLPPNLKEVLFHDSVLNYVITGRIPFGPNNLTRFDLQNNLLHSWKGTVSNVHHMKYFDGSNNYCTFISDEFFNESPNLETLLIHDNLLGNVLYNDTNGNIFRRLTHLKVLDLSWNRIQAVPNRLLKNQNELQILNISNNELTSFDLKLKHMTNLSYINLSHNQLYNLSKYDRDQIDSLKRSNLTVNLYGNKLQCSCETLDFLKWLDDNKAMFDNFRYYNCRFPNNSRSTFMNFENVLIGLKKSCYDYTGVIAGISSAIVLVISLIISGIVYRYRWKLRYLYYMAQTRYKGYAGLKANGDSQDNYKYNAFISYCEQDAEFVRSDLLDNLEKRSGLKLCLHQRDFTLGQSITKNITRAINQSRKTVAIVSRNYLKSNWCDFEFNMARMESIHARAGEPVLLLVFYEDIPHTDLPWRFMDLVESKSYIEYPHDEQGNVVFWDKLAETLST